MKQKWIILFGGDNTCAANWTLEALALKNLKFQITTACQSEQIKSNLDRGRDGNNTCMGIKHYP